jgi:hypothetical protein
MLMLLPSGCVYSPTLDMELIVSCMLLLLLLFAAARWHVAADSDA